LFRCGPASPSPCLSTNSLLQNCLTKSPELREHFPLHRADLPARIRLHDVVAERYHNSMKPIRMKNVLLVKISFGSNSLG
jgi:hypothetical protein